MGHSDSVNSLGLESTLRDAARRVGAHGAMLLDAAGRIHASVGLANDSTQVLASHVSNAVAAAHLIGDEAGLTPYVEINAPDNEARLYARWIVGDRILVVLFAGPHGARAVHVIDPDPLHVLRQAILSRLALGSS